MRLLFFNRSFYPDTASTGQLLTELCEDLVRIHKHEVTVVAAPAGFEGRHRNSSPAKGFLVSEESYRGIRILRTASSSFSKNSIVGRVSNYVTYFLCSFFAGFRMRPDVVIAYTDPPIIGLVAWFWSRVRRARFVMVCQDIFPQVAVLLEGFRSRIVTWILERVSRFELHHADAIVAIGETMKERLAREKAVRQEMIRVIHNWADTTAIVPGTKQNPFATANHLDKKFVVMHSGNIGLSQSLETLVDAAVHLSTQKDIVFVIVGEGTKKPALMDTVKRLGLENVMFLPYQPKEKLTDSFGSADAFVILLKNGMSGYIVPSKLYGILAAGRPYVAAVEESSEVTSITRKYDCGLIARPEDAADLANQILKLYQDVLLCTRLGANARTASYDFDRERQVNGYAQLFKEIS